MAIDEQEGVRDLDCDRVDGRSNVLAALDCVCWQGRTDALSCTWAVSTDRQAVRHFREQARCLTGTVQSTQVDD